MHSFLIASKDKKIAENYINDLCNKEKIGPIDVSLNAFEKAMGIPDVRNIQKSILLKPFRGKTKAVLIEAYGGITTEAQSALLKVLEEPPANTIIIISVPKKELLLSTIISRCKVVELNDNKQKLSNEETTQLPNYLITLSQSNVGDKLKLAQDISRNKEETALWLEKMAIFVRTKLLANYNNPKYSKFLRELQKTYTIIKSTNVSHRIALENLFLSF